jgi:precorrin-6Y C5,15-methyltransferase (decarboxylating)
MPPALTHRPVPPAARPGPGRVTVLGYDGAALPPEAASTLAAATLVVGGERHLAEVPVPPAARRVVLGDLAAGLDVLVAHDGPAVVVASGDPGFFGVVRALRARGLAPAVVPARSSVALAFARLGLPWDDALVVTAHGRDPRPALNAALAAPKAAVLTAPGAAASLVGPLLTAGREVHVAERLGSPAERVARVTEPGGEHADPNVIIAVDPTRPAGRPGWLAGHPGAPAGWALPEDAFAHRDSMVTKAEVRALVLARLAPRPGTCVWDVGAGSGSVAVECARFGAYAVALERDPASCARIADNARVHGVHVRVVQTDVLQGGLDDLSRPDAAFVGGGGPDVLAAVLAAGAATVVATLAAVDRVRPALAALRAAGYATEGVQLQANRLSDLPGGSVRLAATNPVVVLTGVLSS